MHDAYQGANMTIKTVGVLGCGTMGSGIAEIAARGGYDVIFRETDDDRVAAGLASINASLDKALERGKIDEVTRDLSRKRITGTTELKDLAVCDLVIEAIPEHLSLKQEAFRELDAILGPDAVLASNTSSLPIVEMATATSRPSRVIGIHFFNPAPVMGLVEMVKTIVTNDVVLQEAREFVNSLGKTPITCMDRAGFIANLLLFPYLNNAVKMLESGYASREDIDASMRFGCGHPMGPLALVDLIGLDTCAEILEAMYSEFHEQVYAPAPIFKQLVSAGYLGRKTGRGFYTYDAPGSSHVIDASGGNAATEGAAAHIKTVGVLGSGTMANGIAEVLAKSGLNVVLRARTEQKVASAKAAVEKSLARAVAKGKMTEEQLQQIAGRISGTTELSGFSSCDLIIEAVAEELEVKIPLFEELDRVTPEHCILATTTSSLPIIELARATNRPEKVIGMHFFNPAPIMKLVEVVRTVRTDESTFDAVLALATKLGKHPVVCGDRAGFIVNALLFPYLNDAARMLESGYASAEDIDTAMKLGCGHPMGPFALSDIVGLDVTTQILHTLYAEFREKAYAPVPMLEHLVSAGFLGRKTGRGFYAY
jgi:3-hydroxybutyryl-CoA dehydrogenase